MKSKRILMVLFASVAILLTGCEKEKDSTGDKITVKVGQTYDLGSAHSWQTSKPFVATVTDNGVITGKHVGECTVSSSAGSYRVSVAANTTLYKEPITQWGISQSEVIEQEGSNYKNTTDDAIVYETGNPAVPLLGYAFSNGQLVSAIIYVKATYLSQALDHLSDRYVYITDDDSMLYFTNGTSVSDVTTGVLLNYGKLTSSGMFSITYLNIQKSDKRTNCHMGVFTCS